MTRKQAVFLIVINALISALITLLLVVVILPVVELPFPHVARATTAVVVAQPSPSRQATSVEAEPEPAASATPVIHIVRSGDTISGLALEYDVPGEDIIAANQLENPDFLPAGARLIIPVGGVQPPPTATLTAVPTVTPTPLPFEPPSVAATATAEAAARTTASPPEPTRSTVPVTGGLEIQITEVMGAGQADQERVVVTNLGDRLADMQGWTLSDNRGNSYTFPNVRLWPGGNLTIHTRGGEDGSPVNNFYWGNPVAVWSPGKVIMLKDAAGNLVSSYTAEP